MKILVTCNIPRIGIELLQDHFEVDINSTSETLSRSMLKEKIKDADAILCLLTDQIDREIIDAAPRLKIISNHAVGYDNIDVAYATEKGIAVTNTPGVLTDATADFAWTLLMSLSRKVVQGDKIVRAGKFEGWDPLFLLGGDIVGKTLGIIGAGRIGSAVTERSAGWKMNILYFDNSVNSRLETEFNARKVSLQTLLQESDFVTIHLPLSEETKHLIDSQAFQWMKPTAYLINTARGAIVDEGALVKALQKHKIAGVALDVYENEPALAEGLVELENVLLAPHIASATVETRDKMAEIAARNIIRLFQGQEPVSIVNPQVLKL